ncbi:MAG: heme-binding protein [Flavobacteriales bacterium]|nr:heme-binding protein [Flavobacteriales bacterium]
MNKTQIRKRAMAFLLIFIGILVVGFTAVQIFAWKSQQSIESYPYTVEKSFGDFEIRAYEASLFTSVKLGSNEYKKASSQGFSILAGYIFGANEKQEKIAMTSPVAMSLEDSMTMMFMVPKKFNKSNLPKPNQSDIEFKEMPAKRVAAITFGGWSDDEKIALHKEQLTKALDEAGIGYSTRFYYLGYNPPYEVFGRKNEVIVELD